jgi:hypothetical protein
MFRTFYVSSAIRANLESIAWRNRQHRVLATIQTVRVLSRQHSTVDIVLWVQQYAIVHRFCEICQQFRVLANAKSELLRECNVAVQDHCVGKYLRAEHRIVRVRLLKIELFNWSGCEILSVYLHKQTLKFQLITYIYSSFSIRDF